MYGYIYLTTNNINGKQYIGQKKSDVFLKEKYLGSGTYLKNSVKKYGKENFSVELLEECESKEELNEREIYWISYFNACDSNRFYNQTYGGEVNGKRMSESSRKKLSESHNGMKLSDEHKKSISKSLSGIKKSNSTRHKMSIAQSGVNNPHYNKKWVNKNGKNITVNIEKINDYLSNGWSIGMCKNEIAHNKNKICINDGKTNKYVYDYELEQYLSVGYEIGRWNKTNYK